MKKILIIILIFGLVGLIYSTNQAEAAWYSGSWSINASYDHPFMVNLVLTQSSADELDYTFADEVSAEEDIWWNTLSLGGGAAGPTGPGHEYIIITSGKKPKK